MKQIIKYILILIYSLVFTACEDTNCIINIYNKELLKQDINCLKLKIEPYSKDIYNSSKKLYKFTSDNTCKNSLKIRYKSNIVCNSPYSTNKSYHSFIELSLSKDNKVYYSVDKDLKDNINLQEEINKIFENYILEYLKNRIKIYEKL